jgi:cobyrinic acid a,c-diamide synthase
VTASHDTVERPAMMIAAPASGHGKTTVTAALARVWRDAGLRVRVLKTGPDFLDPMVLAHASGAEVVQLDTWMGGTTHCAALLHRAAREADVVLVEGAMGLHDGTPSCADVAAEFGLPVVVAIDASAMAETFGAVALGLATYRPVPTVIGALANRCGGPGHVAMLRGALPPAIAWYGALPWDDACALPSRHLGLVQAGEVADVEQRIAAAARALLAHGVPPMPPVVRFAAPSADRVPLRARRLDGLRIAVAQDAAFAFVYPANLRVLHELGAVVARFSPLADEPIPDGCDALWLPGGYPELHLDALAGHARSRASVLAHHAAGRPMLAECGGLLWLLDTLSDRRGRRAPMLGLLPGTASIGERCANIGLQAIDLPGGEVRGQTFHHAVAEVTAAPSTFSRVRPGHGRPEPAWRRGRLTASFLHLYFASNPAAIAALFDPAAPD